MKQFLQGKYPVLIFSLLALLALLILASGLRDAAFQPGQPVGRAESTTIRVSVDRAIGQIVDVPIWRQIVFWLIVFVIVLLVSSLLSPELRKKLIMSFIRLAAFVLILLYIVKNNPGILAGLLNPPQLQGESGGPSAAENLPPPAFEPPHISSFLSYLITFGVILLVIAVVWLFSRWWARRQASLASLRSLDEIAAAARASLDDLDSGRDWDDAIIQCYARMSRVLSLKRGLRRAEAMTPAEFVSRLERAGLPLEPVQRLTRLFESVRYGARKSGQSEIEEARACLTSILNYCGESV